MKIRSQSLRLTVLAAILACIAGCFAASKNRPPSEREILRAGISPVCIVSQATTDDAPWGELLGRLEVLASEELERVGVRTVASRETGLIVDSLMKERPLFDPHEGTIESHTIRTLRSATNHALAAQLGCKTTLHLSLNAVSAGWEDSVARWDGAREKLGGSLYHGLVPALSVWASVRDRDANEIHFGAGGVCLLGEIEGGLLRKPKLALHDADHLAQQEDDRLRDAVRLSLNPYVNLPPKNSKVRRQGRLIAQ